MKIHGVNTFYSHCQVLIIVTILYSRQKYHYYVNSLVVARKQKGRKIEKKKINGLGARPLVYLSMYDKFQLSRVHGY
jgi:hypothetical protein